MQGQNVQINEVIQLAALAVMTKAAYSLGKAFSPSNRGDGSSEKPEGQAELVKKFMDFNLDLQRGMLSYAERMRKGYRKVKG